MGRNRNLTYYFFPVVIGLMWLLFLSWLIHVFDLLGIVLFLCIIGGLIPDPHGKIVTDEKDRYDV